ncbi:MAG TPA: hypothetical protein VFJ58_19765 [Armatimonadota bacterium]|nr:hypothetical protein [Armatimonadota bacterium]
MIRLSRRAGFVTSRGIPWLLALVTLAMILSAFLRWRINAAAPGPEAHVPKIKTPRENAPMCPWRDPRGDLRRYYPGATGYTTEIWILSGQRLNLAQRLGRQPTAEENRLYLYRVYAGARPLGTVTSRRVKGEFGGIEVVVAVDALGRTLGIRVQRSRERPETESLFNSSAWLQLFRGRNASDPAVTSENLRGVPADTRVSAAAVEDGVRSMLIEMEIASQSGLKQPD